MLNPLLKTFMTVAECGSFLKASEKLFISPPAIMKQMSNLEQYLGMTLLNRSSRGIELTAEGLSIYEDAKKILRLSNEAIERARAIQKNYRYKIRVGSSLLYPANILVDSWNKFIEKSPNYQLKIIPFEDSEKTSAAHVIGTKCDLVIGAYDATQDTADCNFLKLGEYNFCLAMSRHHNLATKKILRPYDILGEKLQIMREGNSPRNDEVRRLLTENFPQIILEDVPFHYSSEHFNRCEEENCLLLTLDGWKNIHPSLVTIPFDVDVKLPYGILYAKDADKNILRFLEIVKNYNE